MQTDNIGPPPDIFVRPPLSRFPRSPKFAWQYIRIKATDLLGRLATVISSKPTMFKTARFKQNNSALVPTAKALHRSMYEALARGDTAVLKRVCGEHFVTRFNQAISSRPPGRRYGWELVKYNKTMFFPRVMDNKVLQMASDKKMGITKPPVIRQVVVGIASTQRKWEVDVVKGVEKVVPGSEKTADVLEYIVLNQAVDTATWKTGDWKIVSTVGETTPEKWAESQELIAEIEKMS